MRVLCLLALLLLPPLFSQVQDLATTDDGRQVYFASTLRLPGDPPQFTASGSPRSRIYRIAEDGLSLYASAQPPEAPLRANDLLGLMNPVVSGDGRITGFTRWVQCSGGSGCITFESADPVLLGGPANGIRLPAGGSLQLSRSGRFALLSSSQSVRAQRLVNLATGESAEEAYTFGPGGPQAIASDGTAVIRLPNTQFALWRSTGRTPLDLPPGTQSVSLNDQATWILYTSPAAGSAVRLTARELSSAREQEIATAPAENVPFAFSATMSNNGAQVLYVAPALTIANTTDGSRRVLFDVPGERIFQAVLSGSGNAAIAYTDAGRLLRIDTQTGSQEELLPATPAFAVVAWSAPGSLATIAGSGLDRISRLSLNGAPLGPLWRENANRLAVQVPWESPTGPQLLRAEAPAVPLIAEWQPLTSRLNLELYRYNSGPYFGRVQAFHADFAPVTPERPLRPGDVVTVYGTGLGPVQPPVATGQPAPASPLARIAGLLRCSSSGLPGQAEVLYAGLAPSLIGLYQITLRLPSGTGPVLPDLSCSIESAGEVSGTNVLLPQ